MAHGLSNGYVTDAMTSRDPKKSMAWSQYSCGSISTYYGTVTINRLYDL